MVGERATRADNESATVHSESVAEAFASVGNETRLRVLLVLWDSDERPVRFSELQRRVGVDDSGQFRYHLRKLEDRYVRRTSEGYDITMAGVTIVWNVLSGAVTSYPDRDPFPVDGACEVCGAGLELSYRDELLHLTCSACGHNAGMTPFPPSGLVGRTDREIARAFDHVLRVQTGLVLLNICPMCYGAGQVSIVTEAADLPAWLRPELTDEDRDEVTEFRPADGVVTVCWTCSQCRLSMNHRLDRALSFHPEVVAFHRDHGIDLTGVPFWQAFQTLGQFEITVLETDPLWLAVAVTLDDETLWLTVTNEFSVDVSERTPVSGTASGS